MKKYLIATIILGAFFLSGCSNLPENQAKLKLSIDQKNYLLETAKNQEQREKGLMDRTILNKNEGMIFYFDKPDYLSFWMKNTLIPLQIIFINNCEIIDIQEMTVEPDPAKTQKTYISKRPADKAIELNSNSISLTQLGTQVADLCSNK